MSELNKTVKAYLDSNSTTELSDEVAQVIIEMITMDIYGNPSSLHEYGRRMRQVLDVSREAVGISLNCGPEAIIFTSGGTESNNIALRGVYDPYETRHNKIVISAAEHSSVRNTVYDMVEDDDYIREIPLKRDGSLDISLAAEFINEDVSLVSVMLANNETGAVFPVKEIVEMAHHYGIVVHCDAVQAYGKMPIDVVDLGVDLLSISGHKVHSLPGVGALYARRGILLRPPFSGGAHEFNLRPGTENYLGVASLGMAAELIHNKNVVTSELRDLFELGVSSRLSGIEILAKTAQRIPNTSCIAFDGIKSSALLVALNDRNVYVSAGSACASGSVKPSETLLAMGLDESEALSSVRFSFSKYNTVGEAAYAINMVVEAVEELQNKID